MIVKVRNDAGTPLDKVIGQKAHVINIYSDTNTFRIKQLKDGGLWITAENGKLVVHPRGTYGIVVEELHGS